MALKDQYGNILLSWSRFLDNKDIAGFVRSVAKLTAMQVSKAGAAPRQEYGSQIYKSMNGKSLAYRDRDLKHL